MCKQAGPVSLQSVLMEAPEQLTQAVEAVAVAPSGLMPLLATEAPEVQVSATLTPGAP